MPFEKGKKKTGGKQAGAKNKKTLILDSFAKSVVDGGMEKFHTELNKLQGKDYVNAYLSLFEYVKPKLSRVDNNVSGGMVINWNEEVHEA
jgi:hypothetical protein